MVSLPALEQLKLHWKGALDVLKHAQSLAGDWQGKKVMGIKLRYGDH